MKRLGFTGTRHGLTPVQEHTLVRVMSERHAIGFDAFHHGDCVGADAMAHAIAESLGMWTEAHPCNIPTMRAHCVTDKAYAPKPPLERNIDIVDVVHMMIACALTMQEEKRSGTWYTVRYARKVVRPLVIIYPDGTARAECGWLI